MSESTLPTLLGRRLVEGDALLMTVRAVGGQQYAAHVHRIYSRRLEADCQYDARELRLVGSPGTWGAIELQDGETALVFVRCDRGRVHQGYWHSHFTISGEGDDRLAIANWRLLDEGPAQWGPGYLREAAFMPDPAKPWQVAMPFALLERHLMEELRERDRSSI